MILSVEFSFNLATILAFIAGIFSGIILFIALYTLYVVTLINKNEIVIQTRDIKTEEIEEKIKNSQERFLKYRRAHQEITFEIFKQILFDLTNDIAGLYYPESKHPLSELTIKELILLDQYLIEKIENILDKVGLKFLKKIKISLLLNILNMKKNIDRNNVIKASRKIGNFSSKLWSLINFLNPVMWIKRGIINPSINLITKKIFLSVIDTVGKETYHVYSKQAFLDPVLDQEVEKLIEIIESSHEENDDNQILSKEKKDNKRKVRL